MTDLLAQDPVDLPGLQALVDVQALLAEKERLDGLLLRRLADVNARQLHALDGARSTAAWVRRQQSSVDTKDVALARRLGRLPELADAVTGARVSRVSAQAIALTLEGLRRHVDRSDGLIDGQPAERVLTAVIADGVLMQVCEARGGLAADDPLLEELSCRLWEIAESPFSELQRLEQAFVLLAEHVEPGRLRSGLGVLADALLPLQLEERVDRGHRERALEVVLKPDGSGYTVRRGDLDLECGELLLAVLHASAATDPTNPEDTEAWAAARARAEADGVELDPEVPGAFGAPEPGAAGDASGVPHEPRSRVQRRHDALKLALRRLLDGGALGQRDKVAPHLNVTVGLDALHDGPGALPAVTAHGARVPRRLVRSWLADSRLTRVVLGLGRRVTEVSHSERTLKAHERKAMAIQWGHQCAAAACHPPPGTRIIPHHPTPWAQCHSTSLEDTVPLCELSHHDLHSGQLLLLKDGRLLGPDGWVDASQAWRVA